MANLAGGLTFAIGDEVTLIRPIKIAERGIYCRIKSIKRERHGRRGNTLRGWRTRNRLYMRAADGELYPVPQGHGTSNMIKLMERGRLYLLTNGIY